jgi:hypothetical protein
VRGTAVSASGLLIVKVEWRVDSGNLQTASLQSGGQWSFDLNTALYPEGAHDITVVVTDSQGLLTSRTIHLLFSHAPDTIVPVVGPGMLLAAGGGLLALLAIALLARGRRRARRARKAAATPLSPRRAESPSAPGAVRPIRKAAAPRRMRASAVENRPSTGAGDSHAEGAAPGRRTL